MAFGYFFAAILGAAARGLAASGRFWPGQSINGRLGGRRCDVKFDAAFELFADKDVCPVAAGVPAVVGAAGEEDACLTLFGGVGGGDDVGLSANAGNLYGDKIEADGDGFGAGKINDTMDRDIRGQETFDRVAGLAGGVRTSEIDAFDNVFGVLRFGLAEERRRQQDRRQNECKHAVNTGGKSQALHDGFETQSHGLVASANKISKRRNDLKPL